MVEAFANIIGNLVGGSFGQQANLRGLMLSEQAQKRLMKYQAKVNYKYANKDLLSKYTYGRQGLENAGYNPMLALSGINSNSNWASQASVSDANAGSSFNAGVSNALTQQQVEQQGALNESTINNNNADSFLKEQQATTETFRQLVEQNRADLIHSEKVLADKRSSNYERELAIQERRNAIEAEKNLMTYKVGMSEVINGQVSNDIAQQSLNANATQQEDYNKWAKKHPYLKSVDQTITRYLTGGSAGAIGYSAGKHAPTVTTLKKPLGFR